MPIWIILSYFVVSAFCIFSVVGLYGKQKKQYAKSALSTYISFTLVFLVIWMLRLTVPSYIILLSMLTIMSACFLGHYLECYTRSKTFDRYLHAFGSFSFALLSFCILNDFIDTSSSKIFRALFIFLIGNTLGIVFELIEAKNDTKSPVKSQKGLKDTNMDMLFNMIGSVLASLFAYFWLLQ